MKKCKYCFIEVPEKALKCQHCREWLTIKSFSHPFPSIVITMGLVFLLMSGAKYLITSDYDEKIREIEKEYEVIDPEDAIKILSDNLVKEKNYIAIVGEVKNVTKKAQRAVRIDASFYSKDEKLTDHSVGNIVGKIAPGETRGYKILFGKDGRPLNRDYHHYKNLKVRSAY